MLSVFLLQIYSLIKFHQFGIVGDCGEWSLTSLLLGELFFTRHQFLNLKAQQYSQTW